ncbi:MULTISPECIES: phosphatase PAP2 family protein [Erwiniaceae]|uniref:acid phosphatase n=1 Tax=Erwiniaceae TaxID=1903409 RepID=UPI00190AAAAF|nr:MULTISPECIES: phosphatase PAP2 family protein [Erwiniaceae]MBK0093431.1 phosphatase PAP2 family protein [Erwinia sp. S59]MBK0123691.1 phosphatase PAP2 family protein [Pantoea sp. S61]
MKFRLTVICASLLIAQQVHATTVAEAGQIATMTTPASSSATFNALEADVVKAERHFLQGDAASLTRDQIKHVKQTYQADSAWLKASGYDFKVKDNQQAGIALLSSFRELPDNVIKANLATVTQINRDATAGERHQALADAENQNLLYWAADALGPRLGKAFLTAYDKGELGKAAALIKASEVSTGAAKDHFNNPRPFLIDGNTIHLVPDDVIVKDGKPYSSGAGSFPSGHTNTGVTNALLLAEMLPERFEALVTRGARYGFSRIVLGVHYPLDIMGSRMVAQRNVAHYLNDPKYRALFNEARDQMRTALEKECGTSLAECAKSAGKDDKYLSPEMKTFYNFTMTYNLPKLKESSQKVAVQDGAEVLLETALPHLSAHQRRELLAKSLIPSGYPLSGDNAEQSFWQRVDLVSAFEMGKYK